MVAEIRALNDQSGMLCDLKKEIKTKGHGYTLEEMRLNHAISSAETSTKLRLCYIILKKNC